MSRDNFYVILSSADSALYADTNTRGRFITKLAEPLAIDGEWEVALTEIHLPNSWLHITKENCAFSVESGQHTDAIVKSEINIESKNLVKLPINYTTSDNIYLVIDNLFDVSFSSKDDYDDTKLINYKYSDDQSEVQFELKPNCQLLIPTDLRDYISQIFGVTTPYTATAYHGTVKEFPKPLDNTVALVPSIIVNKPTKWVVKIADVLPLINTPRPGKFTIYAVESALGAPHFTTIVKPAIEPEIYKFNIPLVKYNTIEKLVDAVNVALKPVFGDDILLSVDGKKVRVKIKEKKELTLRLTFNEEYFIGSLGELLGLEPQVVLNGLTNDYTGQRNRLNNPLAAFYVHCDLINDVLIGNQKANIIRVITDLKDKLFHVYEHPYYFDLIRNNTQSIEIAIYTDTGYDVEFTEGKTVAYLHFRKKK